MPKTETWSLGSHLDELHRRGLLLGVSRQVDPDTQVSALMAEADRRRRAIQFQNVGGSHFPLVYNVLGDRGMVATALGVEVSDVPDAFARAAAAPIMPERVTNAPSQEVVLTGTAADLTILPTIVHSESDAGRYITAGMVLTTDPDSGARNVSFNRICPVGPHDASIRMMPPQHLGQIQAKAEQRGNDLPIAVVIGMHPSAALGAASSPPLGVDELSIVGGLRGEPVAMTPGITIPFDVPAEAEIVIEGYVRASVREPEGPFGDFLHYYVPEMKNHRFRVTAITHRRSAIYQTMHAGSREDVEILGASREVDILEAVRRTGAIVSGVRLQPTILGAAIAIRPRYNGEGKAVAMAALAAYRWLKLAIVVDSDVDIDDSDDVWWALAMRTRLDEDVVTVPHAGGFPRDEGGMHDARLIIDATAPLGSSADFRRRVAPNAGLLSLDDFIDRG